MSTPAASPPAPPVERGATHLAARLERWGHRPAIVADGAVLTYAGLAARADDMAPRLGAGRRLVMIEGGNDPEVLVAYLAALRAGHVAWLVPPSDAGRRRALLDAFDPDTVVRRDIDGTLEVVPVRPGAAHRLHPSLALLLGTSGSTGAPRLVRLSGGSVDANALAIAEYLGITGEDRALTTLPLHYCYGLSVVHSHLAAGARLVLTDRSVTDPALWDLARREGVTSFAGVPHTFELLDRAGMEDPGVPTLRYVTQAGGRMAPDRVRRVAVTGARHGWDLVVMYGQTEATARMAYLPPARALTHPHAVGVPVPGGDIALEPVDGAPEGVGEVVYRGPNVMLGYAHAPQDLARGREVTALHTGDLGRRGPEGLLEIVGRSSRFVKIVGLRIDMDEVERIAGRMGLRAACAGSDERLVVAVEGEAPPGLGRMLACGLHLPPGRIAVRSVESVPRLPSGKVDLPAVARLADGDDGPAAGDGDVHARLVGAFRTILGRDRIAHDDTFSGLGGDSLSYVEMSLALEEILGVLPSGWPDMTVAELAGRGGARPARGMRIEMNVVLRAVAVCLVVGAHMTGFWPLGGAHVLLAIAGFTFARFGLSPARGGWRLGRHLASVARVAVPAVAWIGAVMLVAGGYSIGTLLLVNNHVGAPSHTDGRWQYWFIEALVQILLVAGLLMAVPAVRRWERARPFAFAGALFAAALVFRAVIAAGEENALYRPHTVVWVFLLGWLIQRADTPRRRALATAAVLVAVPGFAGDWEREAVVATGLLLLLWVPTVTLPRIAARAVGAVAAASLWLYLTHWQVWPAIELVTDENSSVPLTILAGVGIWMGVRRAEAAAVRAVARLRGRVAGGAEAAPGTPAEAGPRAAPATA